MTAEERFRAARQELKQADVADRAAYRERRRQKLLAKKARAKASAAEEGGGAVVQLAAAGEASGSEGGPPGSHACKQLNHAGLHGRLCMYMR